MPRIVRNFWVETTIDGRNSKMNGGPRSKEGGFELTVHVRDDGQVKKAVIIEGVVEGDTLRLRVLCSDPSFAVPCSKDEMKGFEVITKR